MAIQRPGKRALVTLAWEVFFEDQLLEARQKPLDLIGHVLTEPHAHSLAALLRARGLVPFDVELESIVQARTVARADGWQIWQLELTLAENAGKRWRDAAAIAIAAVEQLARRGIPDHAGAEVQTLSAAAWRVERRSPGALELVSGLQYETVAALSVAGPRTFVGEPSELCRTAERFADQLAARSPVITVWADDVSTLGVNEKGFCPPLPAPLDSVAKLVPLVAPDLQQQQKLISNYAVLNWQAPPANPWVPTSFEPPTDPMLQVGYRLEPPDVAVDSGEVVGFRRLQLPGCVKRRTAASLSGSIAALTGEICPAEVLSPDYAKLPLAVAAVQLFSPRPAAADAGAALLAELWRITLLQALADRAAGATRAGLKYEISFNNKGMRLLVSGYGQQLPRFLLLVLQKTLRHVPPPSQSPEFRAALRVAKYSLGKRNGPKRTLENLATLDFATPQKMQREISGFFGSVTGASILLTGALASDEAEALSFAVRKELKPMIKVGSTSAEPESLTIRDAISEELRVMRPEQELQTWQGLLYKPVFLGQLAQSECLDPALARALDLCGAI
jgi:hypothetical protein